MNFIKKERIIIGGPCSVESREQLLSTCQGVSRCGGVTILRGGVWKPRTKPGCFEGVGEIGLEWLAEAKRLTGLDAMVEVANGLHVESALKYGIDTMWIGARSTVNPFTVQEVADALRGVRARVFIKNPINPDVALWSGAVERLARVGVENVGLIHRGFSTIANGKYRNEPFWHLAMKMRELHPELALVCDPSHMSGNKNLIKDLSQRAADLGYDGLMIESHVDPVSALSDNAQQVTPNELCDILKTIEWGRKCEVDLNKELGNAIDDEIAEMIKRRMKEVGEGYLGNLRKLCAE